MGIERSCAVPPQMTVGFNYPIPWNVFGTYFGGGRPPGSQPAMDSWTDNLRKNLVILRDQLNMRVIRIFLLGNAANYGTFVRNVFTPPPTLHPKFVEHLIAMLQVFRDTRMLVIPSVVDFKAIGRFKVLREAIPPEPSPGGTIPGQPAKDNGCGDRDPIVSDETIRDFFLKQVIERLVVESIPFRDVVYAWEVQNEPRWNVGALVNRDHIAGGATVSTEAMSAFLAAGVAIIKKHGFQSTVGHRFEDDMDEFPTGSKRQFHFYPLTLTSGFLPGALDPVIVDRHLERYSTTRAFLGEIGTSTDHGVAWPDLEGADAGGARDRVRERLKFVKSQGYPLVLLWPDQDGAIFNPGVPGGGVDPIKLSAEAQAGVVEFMKLP